jgi:hypothetical protein
MYKKPVFSFCVQRIKIHLENFRETSDLFPRLWQYDFHKAVVAFSAQVADKTDLFMKRRQLLHIKCCVGTRAHLVTLSSSGKSTLKALPQVNEN